MNSCTEKEGIKDARISQSAIGNVYDRIAPLYNIWANLTESRARGRAIELAGLTGGQTILEVAVGTGLAFNEIVKKNPHGNNIGIDISDGMLKRAHLLLNKTGNNNYSLKKGTAFSLEIETESVDILFNNYMFDLIQYDDMSRILAEFRRVLKKNGRLVLVNMTKGEKWGSNIYDRIYSLKPELMGGCRGVRLAEKLGQDGFSVETREYHQQFLFPSEVIIAQKM